ncbi:copper-binding protein [Leptothrix sp. BB-4]
MTLPNTLRRRLGRTALATVLVGVIAGLAGPARAQTHAGEVVRVDKGQAKVTIKHGPIAELNLPAMAMAYRVSDAQWLDQLKNGDRVRFDADKVGGLYTVTRLTVVR